MARARQTESGDTTKAAVAKATESAGARAKGAVRAPSPAGYSGTPLAKKLGLSAGQRVVFLDEPAGYRTLLGALPDGVEPATRLGAGPYDLIHLFTKSRKSLEATLGTLGERLQPAGALWISWPKKTSGVATDVTEDVLRELALPRGLVDNKVCAIDATWSGLRLVWRKELRPAKGARATR